MHRFFFLTVALLTACTSFPAVSAKITVTPQASDRPMLVSVEGELVASDGDEFIAKTALLKTLGAIVVLDSAGGSLVAGLQIGEAIRQKKFSTTVAAGTRCASACALAWLAGVPRSIGAEGRIGFHAAYDSDTGRETGVGNALVGAYLTKWRASVTSICSKTTCPCLKPTIFIRFALKSAKAGHIPRIAHVVYSAAIRQL
jgi:hypothetical protein